MRARLASLACAALLGCAPDAPAGVSQALAVSPSVPAHPPGELHRGLNLGNALDAPTEGAWGVVLDAAFFDAIAAAGFDHVRIPIRFSAHAAPAAPYTIDEAFFRRVDWAVDQALGHGMSAIVDLHHYEELMADPERHAARFVGLWRQIAGRYRARSPAVIYELLNEPDGKLTAVLWNALLREALAAVRAVDSGREVIVDSAFWAAARELRALEVPADDPHLMASFHMYQPMLFTHQGMSFMTAEYQTVGVLFPGPPAAPITPVAGALAVDWVADWFRRYDTAPAADNPSGPRTVIEQLELARVFMERTRVPVYMGEFGCGDRADRVSRATWTRLVRTEAERRGIGWAYWDNGGAFKAYDRKAGRWDPDLRAALLQ